MPKAPSRLWGVVRGTKTRGSDLALLRPQYSPFNIGRVFLIDDDIKLKEVEKLTLLPGEGFAETKHRWYRFIRYMPVASMLL